MNFIQQIERLQKLNKLIEQEKTGTPKELAKRLGVTRRTLYRMIESIRLLGVYIEYDRKSMTFYYQDSDRIDIQFSLRILHDDEIKKIAGGIQLFSFRAIFWHGAKLDSPYNLY